MAMTSLQQVRRVKVQLKTMVNSAVRYLGSRGLHGKAIAEICGVSRWTVYKVCNTASIKLREYRDGQGPVGSVVAAAGRRVCNGH